MTCEETRILLHALIDGELDAGHAREVEAHVASCPRCAAQLRDYREMRQALSAPALRHQAPAALRARIEGALPQRRAVAAVPSRRSLLKGLAMGSVLSGALAASLVVFVVRREEDQRILGDVVSAHLRSLQGDHLIDVQSTDQHTVKPWFNGRLDVAPPVVDLTAQGFTLIGGRLDYLDGRPVAAIVYKRRAHVINLFVAQVAGGAGRAAGHDRAGAGLQHLALDPLGSRLLGGQRHQRRGAAGIRRQARGRGAQRGLSRGAVRESWTRRLRLSHSRPMDKQELNVRAISWPAQAPKDAPVTVKGWVRTRRDSKAGISFVHLSDGSSFHPLQVVAPNTLPNYADEVQKLTAGCAVEATGTIVPSPAKGQPFEMQASAIKVIGWVEDPDTYPIQPKPHTMEFLREVAHLRPRTNVIAAATRVRHTLAQAIHRFFDQNGFFWVNTPIITVVRRGGRGRSCSGCRRSISPTCRAPRRAEIDFAKDFFGRETFLTVSGQLNVEAYCLALTKVYTFGPTFRAENSNTSRHLAEFWMIEPEIAFADLADDATLAERLLKFTFETLLKERQDDLAFFDERIEKGLVAKLQGIVASRVRAHGLRRGDRGAGAGQREVRVPGQVGHRPAVGARALSHREARQEAGDRDELPQGHQGVLHAGQ